MLGSLVALICALRCIVARGWPRWVCAAGLLLSPASAFTVAVGQNSFLTTALLVGGFGLIARAPLLAGVLLGLLACKPQLWLMVPVALLAARAFRVLACTFATAALLALGSLAAFGLQTWRQWLTLMLAPNPQYRHWLQFGRLNGQSAYSDATLLGASPATANVVQLLVTLSCAALVWWCFARSKRQPDLKLAVLLTATILAAPHVSNYDAVMVAVAVGLYLCWALRRGFAAGDTLLIVVVSSIELLNPPQMVRLGLITPLVLCALLAAVMARRPIARVHPIAGANIAPAQ
jgi:alpha-1,2-mannosyltransferase